MTPLSEPFHIKHMPLDDWLSMPDYPYLPDKRVAKNIQSTHWSSVKNEMSDAIKTFLSTVAAAQVDENLYKLDGHTRSILWRTGALSSPAFVNVLIYRVESMTELAALYNFVQSEKLIKHDRIVMLYQELGMDFRSDRLKHGLIYEAMSIALRGKLRDYQDKRSFPHDIDLRRSLLLFKEPLHQLDRLLPKKEIFLTGVLAAALIMISMDPKRIAFFEVLNDCKVEKKGERFDPVGGLLRAIAMIPNEKSGQAKIQTNLCGRTIRALSTWEAGPKNQYYWLRSKTTVQDIVPLVRQFRQLKSIVGDPYM